jgi:hypothetical protein
MAKFFIVLPDHIDRALKQSAREHFRDPQQEAVWLITQALEAARQAQHATAVANEEN